MKSLVLAFAFFLAACGGKAFVDTTDGGHTGDGGDGDDGGSCGAPPPSCVPIDAKTCKLDCNTCSCTNGGWGCTDIGCVSPVCPSTPPPPQSFCEANGQVCTFGPGCGPQCTCDAHQWKCVEPPCPPPVCPPSPPNGSCSGEVGLDCSYGSGCNMVQCQCVASSSGPEWVCSGTGCVDAGHTGDGGH